jgi:catechol 2,3-dioxygenase-like lactoylglutathione lyase family enzyme
VETLDLKWPNWLGVVVDDLDAQRRFYRDVLGFKELETGDGWVQFDMGWPNLLELLQRSDEPQYDRPRYQAGYAVVDIRAARDELITRGAEPLTGIEGGPEASGLWCYFRDPEGNVFEISQRVGKTWASE